MFDQMYFRGEILKPEVEKKSFKWRGCGEIQIFFNLKRNLRKKIYIDTVFEL